MSHDNPRASALRTMARDLLRIADELDGYVAPVPTEPAAEAGAGRVQLGDIARKAYRARRDRDRHFPGDLFFEPAWDILLDLYIAACDRKRLATTSVCIASGAPHTTALRYIDALVETGLAARRPDGQDSRRVFIEITPDGEAAMTRYFRGLDRSNGRPVAEVVLRETGNERAS